MAEPLRLISAGTTRDSVLGKESQNPGNGRPPATGGAPIVPLGEENSKHKKSEPPAYWCLCAAIFVSLRI